MTEPTAPTQALYSPARIAIAALLVPFLALVPSILLQEAVGPRPLLFFYPAIFISGWLGGAIGGAASSLLCIVLARWFLIEPRSTLAVVDMTHVAVMGTFLLLGAANGIVHQRLRKSVHDAREAARREARAEQIYRRMFEASIDAIELAHLDKRTRIVNAAAARMFGRSPEALATAADEQLVDTQDPRLAAAMAERERAGAWRGELFLLRADGSRFPAEVSSVIFTGPDGERMSCAFLRDVSERKQSEQALAERESMFRAVCEASSAGICMSDPALIYVNPALCSLMGYPEEALLGRNTREFVHPDDLHIVEARDGARERGDPVPVAYTIRIITASGDARLVEVVTNWTRRNGRPAAVQVVQDITERHAATQELARHRADLQALVDERTRELHAAMIQADAANRAKTNFLATMSHEIRTPLNAILGFTRLISRKSTDAQLHDWSQKAARSGDHLLAVVDDVLNYAKLESGQVEPTLTAVDLRALVSRVVASTQEAAHAKGLRLSVRVAEIPPVLTDEERVSHALQHLLSNAVKFTATGSVSLQVRRQTETDASMTVRFEVTDTGIGIAPDVMPSLFAPFHQADNTNTRAFGGTGLGLALTRKLALLLGGDAGASSVEGQGSTFWFSIRADRVVPAVQSEATPDQPAGDAGAATAAPTTRSTQEGPATPWKGKCALLVDDDLLSLEVTQALLEDLGLRVDTAANGEQAVGAWRSGTREYALILMDMQMPRMDGLQATTELRRLGCTVPIVALTANAFEDDRRACMAAGMNDFLAKPVEPGHLYSVVLPWLEGQAREA